MALQSYSTGTIAIAANATSVVGSGTLWNEANARAGDTLIVDGHQVLIEDLTDATHLVIDEWPFSAVLAGASYKIVHTSPLRFSGVRAMLDVDALVNALDTNGYLVIVPPSESVPNPSLGQEDQFAFQWGTGKLWVKSGGAWVLLGLFKGFNAKGSWNGATAYVIGDVVSTAGGSYLCVADHTNQVPPNVTYWQLIASNGTNGAAGATAWSVPAAWVTATNYVVGPPASVVTFAGETYVCLVAHTAGTFATDLAANKWIKIASKGDPAWSVPAAWVTATNYVVGPPASVVVQGGESYVCLVSHTSGVFATDLAASNWIKITQKGTGDLLSSNNLSDVANPATALNNLNGVSYSAVQAYKKNYLTNGDMMISQENGTTAGTVNSYYPVDKFFQTFSNAGVVSVQQVASRTPAGSPNRLRATVTTADASVAAGDYHVIGTRIEGYICSDLNFGTANAKSVVLRFGVKAPAGTYCIAFRNGAFNRTHVKEFTITGPEANTDVVKFVTLTGDLSGTWAVDNTLGIEVLFCLMAGTTVQGSAGSWQASAFFATSNQFNLLGTISNVFELFDVALIEGNALPATHVVANIADELRRCQREVEKSTFNVQGTAGAITGRSFQFNVPFKQSKRAVPTITFSGTSTARFTFGTSLSITTEKFGISGTNTDATGDDFTVSTTWLALSRI